MKSSLAINIHDKREKNPSGKVFHEDFLSFEVNIKCSAEQSSVYCHYFLFFGHRNHSISTPGAEKHEIMDIVSILQIPNLFKMPF